MKTITYFAKTCPTCGKPPGAPFRVYDKEGKVISGCVDEFHTGHIAAPSESGRWHVRPHARKVRAEMKRSRLGGVTQYKDNPKRRRRKNPGGWYIHIQRSGRGPVMLYNGKSFSNQAGEKPHAFKSAQAARIKARALLGQFNKLSAYKIWVADTVHGAAHEKLRVNPSPRQSAALDEAARKLEDFTGHDATHVQRARLRSAEKTGLVIGEMDEIGYRAAREGIEGGRLVRYRHKFRRGSRPLLAVSTDGKQLHVVGGQYEFTAAGIEDR